MKQTPLNERRSEVIGYPCILEDGDAGLEAPQTDWPCATHICGHIYDHTLGFPKGAPSKHLGTHF